VCGAGLALLPKRPPARALTAAGLLLAAAGLVALDLAGLAAPSGRMLMLLCAPVAAGLILLLAGLVAGYLAAGRCSCARLPAPLRCPRRTPRWRRRPGAGR
jgi:hypothetical protein